MKQTNWNEWYKHNLKDIIAETRRMVKYKFYLALNLKQRENLADTCADAIKAIREVQEHLTK